MNPLENRICQRIRKEGPITFRAYMEMALYEPGLGYYTSAHTEIGKAGDFYTSQHLHPAFGAMIARQLMEMWEIMNRPEVFHIIEPGAGAGLMCLDILTYLREKKDMFRSISYIIAEINPSVMQRQKTLLSHYSGKVTWVSSLEELPGIQGCIVSNELLDAFPVHLVEMHDGLKEIYITVTGEKSSPSSVADNEAGRENETPCLQEIKGPPSTAALYDYLREFSIQLPEGYRTEINLGIRDWLRQVNETLSGGFILTIDYGYPAWEYYSEERNRGTLLCYHRHQVNENPCRNTGQQDMTAHVNFSSVKKWGEDLGLKTLGFCQQGIYLISLGIDEIINELYSDSSDYLFEVAKIKKLIFPGTLGETHKVLIQYKGDGIPQLRGFMMKNQADKL